MTLPLLPGSRDARTPEPTLSEATLLRAYGLDPDTLTPITSADRAPHGRYGSDDLSRAPSDGPVGVGEYGREPSMGSPTPEGTAPDASAETAAAANAHPGSRSAVGVA